MVPTRLYHYTTPAGLHGIVSSGVLKASNFSCLNDSTEITYGLKLARQVIEEYMRGHKALAKMLDLVENSLPEIEVAQDFYLACFCTKPDLLSQWRGYGSEKGRFCIGFSTENLQSDPTYKLGRVLYDPAEQTARLYSTTNLAAKAMEDGNSRKFVEEVASLLITKLVSQLCFFKHPGFSEEHEWRMVHAVEPTDQIEFEAKSGLLRPYVRFWGDGDREHDGSKTLPIVEIVVGASGLVPVSKKTAALLLARCGYHDVRVSESVVPYRDL